jgi:tight adherence protein B
MISALIVFVIVTIMVMVLALRVWAAVAASITKKRLDERLREVGQTIDIPADVSVINQISQGRLSGVEKLIGRTSMGPKLSRLIEQSGTQTTPSTIAVYSAFCAFALWFVTGLFVHLPLVGPISLAIGGSLPTLWLMRRRTVRLRRFEEQFPEALDLLSRAMRAGHAFQTALGTAGDELPAPVGVELKKVFDRQNFGLPLNDALKELTERIPLIDVKFFVTAVAIQRESGGNLAEILDNLAHVVRERFKVQRQVRTHTAHGRFTGFVLLALPAALALALSFIAPEQMRLLFTEPMGRMMIVGAIVMQTLGFFWIRKVIKIEV